MNKIEALAKFLDCNEDYLFQDRYDESLYTLANEEYLVLTDSEADERTADYIRETLWAFNPSFLCNYLPKGVTEDVVRILQDKCEGANEPLLAMVDDRLDDLIQDAIGADGRGHFVNNYDGEEHEAGEYFIYRVN
jgi:hypothetical protein